MGSVPGTSIYMETNTGPILSDPSSPFRGWYGKLCRIDASVKLTLKKKFGAVLRVHCTFTTGSQRWKGRGEYGRNFVSRGKVGLISDDYKVLQRVPDALWNNYFHFHFHIRPGCPFRTRWRRWRRRRKRLVETTRNKRFPTLISCIFLSPAKKKYVALLLQPPLLDLVGHLADGERPPAAAARVDGVGHHVVLGFAHKFAKKYLKEEKNGILIGAYFYLDSEPLPDLDPQADHGGEAGEFYFFKVNFVFILWGKCVYQNAPMQ